ncbi:hypothetical protein BHM03_00045546 [Ensete ventricosum]|nr:hypothetical protein BHM03_00045546 [Ensete ventricosum]
MLRLLPRRVCRGRGYRRGGLGVAATAESARLGSARVRKLVCVGRKAQERLTELARERAFAGSGQECASGSSISGSAEGSYKKAS